MFWEEIATEFAGSIFPTVVIVIVAVVTRNQIRKLDVKINGRLSQLLDDADKAGELRGREDERHRSDDERARDDNR